MALHCPCCRRDLLWWDLKPSFSCPACGARLEADTRRAWAVTLSLWLAAMAPVVWMAARDAEGPAAFALGLAGPVCMLGLGYAIGSRVFRGLVWVRHSPRHGP